MNFMSLIPLPYRIGIYITVFSAITGGAWYAFDTWHNEPIRDRDVIITTLNKGIVILNTNIITLEAQKEKLIGDMSTIYDDGYYAGMKEGYKHEKSNTATIHSIKFPF